MSKAIFVLAFAAMVLSASATRQEAKDLVVDGLLAAKKNSNVTFNEISEALGLTNIQTADIFYRQARLFPNLVQKMKAIVPNLTDTQIDIMKTLPFRSFDPAILQEPHIYRLYESITQNGNALVALLQELFGDGIMSAINFYGEVAKIKGTEGDDRVIITFNGKFLPHIAQYKSNNTLMYSERPKNGTRRL